MSLPNTSHVIVNIIGVGPDYDQDLTLALLVHLHIECKVCHKKFCIEVQPYQWYNYEVLGYFIQDAFRDMDADTRELLLSGLCGPCYDDLTASLD